MYATHSSPVMPYRPQTAEVVVYGSRWCGITIMVRRHLDRAGIPYRFVDWDAYPEVRSRREWLAGGRIGSPTVTIGGQVLVQPSLRELDWSLRRAGYR